MEILEIMAEMWHYVIFLSLKPTKVTSDFILYQLKKVVGGANIALKMKKIQNTLRKQGFFTFFFFQF